jgi:hypothetical protein
MALLLASAGMLLVPVLVLMLVPVLLVVLLLSLAGCCCWRWNVSRHTWRQQQAGGRGQRQ